MGHKPRAKKIHTLDLVRGVEGLAIYLNSYRIAGPKPWGGGQTVRSWKVSDDDLRRALKEKR